jgi:hypothetical protein
VAKEAARIRQESQEFWDNILDGIGGEELSAAKVREHATSNAEV